MLKKIILTVLSLSFYACGNLPNGKTTDPSINLADRHIWIPADEEDLEKRRLLQTHFDGIADNIETLFHRLRIFLFFLLTFGICRFVALKNSLLLRYHNLVPFYLVPFFVPF